MSGKHQVLRKHCSQLIHGTSVLKTKTKIKQILKTSWSKRVTKVIMFLVFRSADNNPVVRRVSQHFPSQLNVNRLNSFCLQLNDCSKYDYIVENILSQLASFQGVAMASFVRLFKSIKVALHANIWLIKQRLKCSPHSIPSIHKYNTRLTISLTQRTSIISVVEHFSKSGTGRL